MSIDKKILSTMQEENDMTQKEAGSTGKDICIRLFFRYQQAEF